MSRQYIAPSLPTSALSVYQGGEHYEHREYLHGVHAIRMGDHSVEVPRKPMAGTVQLALLLSASTLCAAAATGLEHGLDSALWVVSAGLAVGIAGRLVLAMLRYLEPTPRPGLHGR